MKTCIVTKPYEYKVIETPIPEPEKGEVLVKMMAAGVCASDYHLYKGHNAKVVYPRVPGHENVGIITKVGAGVTNVKVGDHVVTDLVVACGTCYQCTHGRNNVCESVKARGSSADGGWREYFCLPSHEVYRIDEGIPWKEAALIEPFAIGEQCAQRASIIEDDVVLVLGVGTIGAIILQTCKNYGAKVICVDVVDDLLIRANKYGADAVINAEKENLVERINEITNNSGCTVAFDAACYHGSLSMLIKPGIICNGGRVVSLGFCSDPEEFCQIDITARELDVIGSRMSANQFEKVADNMKEHKYNLDGIATTQLKFSEIDRIFNYMVNPDPDVKKMVIMFDE